MGRRARVAYVAKPETDHDYLATATHFAAKASVGMSADVRTPDGFAKSADAIVYYVGREGRGDE
eukprot:12847537-Alexandrium_andersonii.AAC.1